MQKDRNKLKDVLGTLIDLQADVLSKDIQGWRRGPDRSDRSAWLVTKNFFFITFTSNNITPCQL